MDQIQSAGATMLASLRSFFAFLPTLIGAVLILVIGWFVAIAIGKLIEKALVALGFERAVHRSGVGRFIERAGTTWTTSKLIGELAKWFVFLLFVQGAANLLQMPQVTAILNSILLFIPKLVVALIIVVVGALIGRFLAGLVYSAASDAGLASPNLLATLTNYAVIGFAVVAALDQIGIARVVVDTLFIGLVASVALAVGLAFGLGGRGVAERITEGWYQRGRDAAGSFRDRFERLPRAGD
jgi:Conserved TM helix